MVLIPQWLHLFGRRGAEQRPVSYLCIFLLPNASVRKSSAQTPVIDFAQIADHVLLLFRARACWNLHQNPGWTPAMKPQLKPYGPRCTENSMFCLVPWYLKQSMQWYRFGYTLVDHQDSSLYQRFGGEATLRYQTRRLDTIPSHLPQKQQENLWIGLDLCGSWWFWSFFSDVCWSLAVHSVQFSHGFPFHVFVFPLLTFYKSPFGFFQLRLCVPDHHTGGVLFESSVCIGGDELGNLHWNQNLKTFVDVETSQKGRETSLVSMLSRKKPLLESIRIPTWIKKQQQEDFEQKTSNGNAVSYLPQLPSSAFLAPLAWIPRCWC